MLDGVILLWFVLAALAVGFVAIDIRNTPESPVLKRGFVLLTAYTGVVGVHAKRAEWRGRRAAPAQWRWENTGG